MNEETKENSSVDLTPEAIALQLRGIKLAQDLVRSVGILEIVSSSEILAVKKEFEMLGLDVFDEDREGFSKVSNSRNTLFWELDNFFAFSILDCTDLEVVEQIKAILEQNGINNATRNPNLIN